MELFDRGDLGSGGGVLGRQGLRRRLDGRAHHAIWADNIILFVASRGQLQQMVPELAKAMDSIGHLWNTLSLEYLPAAGSTADLDFQLAVQRGDVLQFY